jgi:hypothetical protein
LEFYPDPSETPAVNGLQSQKERSGSGRSASSTVSGDAHAVCSAYAKFLDEPSFYLREPAAAEYPNRAINTIAEIDFILV